MTNHRADVGPIAKDSLVVYEVAARNFGSQGKLIEITEAIDSIRELGVDVLDLQSVYPLSVADRKGRDGSLYAIADYNAVNPGLGSEAELGALFEKAHGSGMHVLMDIVFNHMGCDAEWLESHPDWFLHDELGQPARRFDDWTDIYDLDFTRPGLRAELIKILHRWVDLGADGFRCDVAGMIPIDFWQQARASFADRDLIWVAESFPPSYVRYLRERGFAALADGELSSVFDLTYDFDGYEKPQAYWRSDIGLAEYLRFIDGQADSYPQGATKLRFLENHDMPRIASIVTSPSGLLNWTLLDMLLPGSFMLSAGQEVALQAQASLFDRTPFEWTVGDPAFATFLTTVAPVARSIKAPCHRFSVKEICRGVAKVEWSGGVEYVAMLNLEDRFGEIDLHEIISGTDVLTGTPVSIGPTYQLRKGPLLIRRR